MTKHPARGTKSKRHIRDHLKTSRLNAEVDRARSQGMIENVNHKSDDDETWIPCELCGEEAGASGLDQSRYALMKGRRTTPVSQLDIMVAQDDKRVVRVCANCIDADDQIRADLLRLDMEDAASVDPEVMERVHAKLMGVGFESLGDAVDEVYHRVRRDLDQLVLRNQIDKKDLDPENIQKTVALLSHIRLEYGDITARTDLREIMEAIEVESEWCAECGKIYPRGTHRHGMDTEKQQMNGERTCDSAELLTLNHLANFSAFEKTIPLDIMRNVDPKGVHMIGFAEHGDTTRGVDSRDFFRCHVFVKTRGVKPYRGQLDILPAYFVRLDEVDDSKLAPGTTGTTRFTLAQDALGIRKSNEGASDYSAMLTGAIDELHEYHSQKLDVEIIPDDKMAEELAIAEALSDNRHRFERLPEDAFGFPLDDDWFDDIRLLVQMANAGAEAVGRPVHYLELGQDEAWLWLDQHADVGVFMNRFKIALAALNVSAPLSRKFTVADIEQVLAEVQY